MGFQRKRGLGLGQRLPQEGWVHLGQAGMEVGDGRGAQIPWPNAGRYSLALGAAAMEIAFASFCGSLGEGRKIESDR